MKRMCMGSVCKIVTEGVESKSLVSDIMVKKILRDFPDFTFLFCQLELLMNIFNIKSISVKCTIMSDNIDRQVNHSDVIGAQKENPMHYFLN